MVYHIKIGKPIRVFKQQADATLNQANPTSGTKYTVLASKKNVRIISISVIVTWTVQPTPLELHLTIDGQSITYVVSNPVTATNYYAAPDPKAAGTAQLLDADGSSIQRLGRAFLIEGKSVKVQAETTGGTVSNLSARVKWAKKA